MPGETRPFPILESPAMATNLTLEPAELPTDAVEVGRIADAWGIKGWFKVLPHSARPEALFYYKRWFLQAPGDSSKVIRLPLGLPT